jgi:hypothetical protein
MVQTIMDDTVLGNFPPLICRISCPKNVNNQCILFGVFDDLNQILINQNEIKIKSKAQIKSKAHISKNFQIKSFEKRSKSQIILKNVKTQIQIKSKSNPNQIFKF